MIAGLSIFLLAIKKYFFQVPVLSTFWFSFEIPYLTTFLSFLAFIQQWQCRVTGKRGQRERGRRTAKGHRLDSNPACWPPAKPLRGLEDLCHWPCAWHPNPLHLCCWPRCRPSKLHRLCWLHCQPPELLCQCHLVSTTSLRPWVLPLGLVNPLNCVLLFGLVCSLFFGFGFFFCLLFQQYSCDFYLSPAFFRSTTLPAKHLHLKTWQVRPEGQEGEEFVKCQVMLERIIIQPNIFVIILFTKRLSFPEHIFLLLRYVA